jgi:hypothetical protein
MIAPSATALAVSSIRGPRYFGYDVDFRPVEA